MVNLTITIAGKTRQDTLDILKGMSLILSEASKEPKALVEGKLDFSDSTSYIFEFVGHDPAPKEPK